MWRSVIIGIGTKMTTTWQKYEESAINNRLVAQRWHKKQQSTGCLLRLKAVALESVILLQNQ